MHRFFCFGGFLRGFFFGTLVNINIVNTYVINIFRPFFHGGFQCQKNVLFFTLHYYKNTYLVIYTHLKKIALHLIS